MQTRQKLTRQMMAQYVENTTPVVDQDRLLHVEGRVRTSEAKVKTPERAR